MTTEMTSESAIRRAIIEYQKERASWEGRDDPTGVVAHLDAMIAALTDAQRDLADYRKIKAALAVLKLG